MRIPLPQHRLVALSLAGGILALGASLALATPGFLAADAPSLPADAPPDDPGFQPAVYEAPRRHDDEREDEHEDDDDD